MKTRVLGVHGVWNYRRSLDELAAAQSISEDWTADLAGSMQSNPFELKVAYYAHHLRRIVPQGGGVDGLDHLAPDVEGMIVAWAHELGAVPAAQQQGQGTVPIRALVDRVAAVCRLSPALAAGLRKFVGVFFREVAAYLRAPDEAARLASRDCVAQAIVDHRPHILIAHSLGSVVAYEALLAHPELQVDLFMTLGSPLGMPAVVYERLQPAQSSDQGVRPPNVGRWVNIADPGDIIAVPRPFTRRFTPDENHERDYIHLVDFHLVGHYLRAAPTARALSTYFSSG